MVINNAMKNYNNQIKFIFYVYLGFILFMYTRPVSIEHTIELLTGLDLDKSFHFMTFFILGAIAQYLNGINKNFIFGISLALIISLFIEFTHFVIPYRNFELIDGFSNILGCTSAIFIVYMYNRNK